VLTLALVAAIVVGVLAFKDDGAPQDQQTQATSTESATSTDSNDPTDPTDPSVTSGSGEPPPFSEADDVLLDLVPDDFDPINCQPGPLTAGGELARLDCGLSRSQPGPQESTFFLYDPDDNTMLNVFQDDMSGIGLSFYFDTFDCVANKGYTAWSLRGEPTGADEAAGLYACRIRDDGSAAIYWTDDAYGLYGSIVSSGGEAGLEVLWEWWQLNRGVPG